MKYRATTKTFFGGRLYEKGEIVELKGSKPSKWFEAVKEAKPAPAKLEKPAEPPVTPVEPAATPPDDSAQAGGEPPAGGDPGQTEQKDED